jgi:putative ABC transport system substrate-binding protein
MARGRGGAGYDPQETCAAQVFCSAHAALSPISLDALSCFDGPIERQDWRGYGLGKAMRRRDVLTLVGGAAAWPLAARAQQASKLPTIGFLGAGSRASWSNWVPPFVQRLRELGWVEGRTVAIEYRWAEGRSERYPKIATEFVRLKVDVIVTSGSAVLAAKQATLVIPIVFAVASDPVGGGLVASLARPGGNVTGLSVQAPDLAGKRLDLLREILPDLHRLAIMANAGYPAAVQEMGEVQAAATVLGLEVIRLEIRRAEEIAPAIAALQGRADALYVCTDSFISANRNRINTLALAARVPMMHDVRDAEALGLISYGPNYLVARGRLCRQDSARDEAR